ncbi:hypothetical protein CWN98_21495 [Vibrio splendidus]|uniref:hypothetical protein n=1 Tax=Vibrio splendidus TaxID=29497 RepID=UPI000D3A10BE|nr:hypothetical protein [Vibrio splendidus]PTO81357.1 hypothetical protein CWN98_21495 [Vibrio splendidus]PTP42133.1 hypothetical protein CWO10_21220 [Vibrio splendidus]
MSNFKLGALLCLSAVVGTLLFWIGLYIWFDEPLMSIINDSKAILWNKPGTELNYKEAVTLGRLVEKGIVLEGNDLLSQVSNFYTTIITILITLITILGISIPLYIKTNAENVAKQQTKHEVRTYFNENVGYRNSLKEAVAEREASIVEKVIEETFLSAEILEDVQNAFDSVAPELKKLKSIELVNVKQLEDKIHLIEKYIQQLDPVERDAAQGQVEDL